jgi:hypothetical protein
MYPFQDCGETKKEILQPDDIAAICAIYPSAKDPKTCQAAKAPGAGCCDSGGGAGSLALGTACAIVLRRRRARP